MVIHASNQGYLADCFYSMPDNMKILPLPSFHSAPYRPGYQRSFDACSTASFSAAGAVTTLVLVTIWGGEWGDDDIGSRKAEGEDEESEDEGEDGEEGEVHFQFGARSKWTQSKRKRRLLRCA